MPETIALTKEDLKEILKANQEALVEAIREIKKPTEMEQAKIDAEKLATEARQTERKTNSAAVLEQISNRRAIQRMCSHEHPNGDSHCVWVQEKRGPGYLICQKNQCIIRPGKAPQGYQGNAIFDSDLFNKIFQKLNTSGADIIG